MAQVVLALIVVAAAVFYILFKAPQTDAQTPAAAAPAVAVAPVPAPPPWRPRCIRGRSTGSTGKYAGCLGAGRRFGARSERQRRSWRLGTHRQTLTFSS